jgi:hypothetical protein
MWRDKEMGDKRDKAMVDKSMATDARCLSLQMRNRSVFSCATVQPTDAQMSSPRMRAEE